MTRTLEEATVSVVPTLATLSSTSRPNGVWPERRRGSLHAACFTSPGVKGDRGELQGLSCPSSSAVRELGRRGRRREGCRGVTRLHAHGTPLHDRRLTGGEGNIDHLAVTRAGVFVIDAKKWTGRIALHVRGSYNLPESRLHVKGSDRTDKILAVMKAANLVRRAFAQPGAPASTPPITPVVCVLSDRLQLDAPAEFRGVRISTTLNALRRLISKAPAVGEPDRVDEWHRYMADAFPPMLGQL